MNRGAHAYDWQIVEFKKKNPQEYMVISKRGLTRYFYDEVEFLKFEQFLAEQQMFDKLSKINYFHQYSKVKHFQIWKRYTRMVNFRERSK